MCHDDQMPWALGMGHWTARTSLSSTVNAWSKLVMSTSSYAIVSNVALESTNPVGCFWSPLRGLAN